MRLDLGLIAGVVKNLDNSLAAETFANFASYSKATCVWRVSMKFVSRGTNGANGIFAPVPRETDMREVALPERISCRDRVKRDFEVQLEVGLLCSIFRP